MQNNRKSRKKRGKEREVSGDGQDKRVNGLGERQEGPEKIEEMVSLPSSAVACSAPPASASTPTHKEYSKVRSKEKEIAESARHEKNNTAGKVYEQRARDDILGQVMYPKRAVFCETHNGVEQLLRMVGRVRLEGSLGAAERTRVRSRVFTSSPL
jgi:hypothetical protein